MKISPWNGSILKSIIPKLKERPPEPKPEDNDSFEPDESEIFEDMNFDFQKEEKTSDTPKKTDSQNPPTEEPSEETKPEETKPEETKPETNPDETNKEEGQ